MDEILIFPDLVDEFKTLTGLDNIAFQYAALYYVDTFTDFVDVPGWFINQFQYVPESDID